MSFKNHQGLECKSSFVKTTNIYPSIPPFYIIIKNYIPAKKFLKINER